MGHKWKLIEDLPNDYASLADPELDSLTQVWRDQEGALRAGGLLTEFEERLKREWAIETGIIEDVYRIDRGTTNTLIERGIRADYIARDPTGKSPELVARIIQDHAEALEGIYEFVRGDRELTTGYIKGLHAALLRNQPTHTVVDQHGNAFEKVLYLGAYKDEENSPMRPDGTIHEYCPPLHVASEMERLVQLHADHVKRNVPVEVAAAWLHHAFTQIHPFADGNGRVARAIASAVFIKARLFPVIVARESRSDYIAALEIADGGNLEPLVAMLGEGQKKQLTDVIHNAIETIEPGTVEDAVRAAAAKLVADKRIVPAEWQSAISTAQKLADRAFERIKETANMLGRRIVTPGLSFSAGVGEGLFPEEILKEFGYRPNFTVFRRGAILYMNSEPSYQLVVGFHGVGARFLGIVSAVIYLAEGSEVRSLATKKPFRITYRDDAEGTRKRFEAWLDDGITRGINMWRATL